MVDLKEEALSLEHVSCSPKLSQLSCDPSKLRLAQLAEHTWDVGCTGAAVVHYCSTLEMEAKKCLKIPNLAIFC